MRMAVRPMLGSLVRSGRRAVVGLAVAMIAMAVLAGPAAAATHTPFGASPAVLEQVTAGVHAATPTPVPPTSTNINQQQHNADVAQAQRKTVVGLMAVVLLVIVYFGHRARYRHRRKLRNLQNAKG